MPEWMVWMIVGGIGLVVAILVHALLKQAQGASLLGILAVGIAGALLAAWILPRLLNIPGVTFTEERYTWAVVGSLVLSLIYELGNVGTHRSRIIIPAPGR